MNKIFRDSILCIASHAKGVRDFERLFSMSALRERPDGASVFAINWMVNIVISAACAIKSQENFADTSSLSISCLQHHANV
jgi:hypothetical protein